MNTHLLVIDPQNDFCDLPSGDCPVPPALPVLGSHADMLRVAALIRAGGRHLNAITVTLDSHHHVDIAHPTFWQYGDGRAVNPFSLISAAALREGVFLPRQASALPRAQAYLDSLEAAGRYTHMVWPVHCEIGSWGHNVHAAVRQAYNAWEVANQAQVNKVVKGTNPWTEHYSAIQAEVPDLTDEATTLNAGLLAELKQADRILITGEAGSHCVKATTEHIVENFTPAEMVKLVIVTDCMSAVTGFEAAFENFKADMAARGARLATAAEVMAEWSSL